MSLFQRLTQQKSAFYFNVHFHDVTQFYEHQQPQPTHESLTNASGGAASNRGGASGGGDGSAASSTLVNHHGSSATSSSSAAATSSSAASASSSTSLDHSSGPALYYCTCERNSKRYRTKAVPAIPKKSIGVVQSPYYNNNQDPVDAFADVNGLVDYMDDGTGGATSPISPNPHVPGNRGSPSNAPRSSRPSISSAKPRHTSSILTFNEELKFGCTLYKSSGALVYSKKVFRFRLKCADKSTRHFMRVKKMDLYTDVNLAAFASKGVRHAQLTFPLEGTPSPPLGKPAPQLRCTITCTWMNDGTKDKDGYSSCSSSQHHAAGGGGGSGATASRVQSRVSHYSVSGRHELSYTQYPSNAADARAYDFSVGGSFMNPAASSAAAGPGGGGFGSRETSRTHAAVLTQPVAFYGQDGSGAWEPGGTGTANIYDGYPPENGVGGSSPSPMLGQNGMERERTNSNATNGNGVGVGGVVMPLPMSALSVAGLSVIRASTNANDSRTASRTSRTYGTNTPHNGGSSNPHNNNNNINGMNNAASNTSSYDHGELEAEYDIRFRRRENEEMMWYEMKENEREQQQQQQQQLLQQQQQRMGAASPNTTSNGWRRNGAGGLIRDEEKDDAQSNSNTTATQTQSTMPRSPLHHAHGASMQQQQHPSQQYPPSSSSSSRPHSSSLPIAPLPHQQHPQSQSQQHLPPVYALDTEDAYAELASIDVIGGLLGQQQQSHPHQLQQLQYPSSSSSSSSHPNSHSHPHPDNNGYTRASNIIGQNSSAATLNNNNNNRLGRPSVVQEEPSSASHGNSSGQSSFPTPLQQQLLAQQAQHPLLVGLPVRTPSHIGKQQVIEESRVRNAQQQLIMQGGGGGQQQQVITNSPAMTPASSSATAAANARRAPVTLSTPNALGIPGIHRTPSASNSSNTLQPQQQSVYSSSPLTQLPPTNPNLVPTLSLNGGSNANSSSSSATVSAPAADDWLSSIRTQLTTAPLQLDPTSILLSSNHASPVAAASAAHDDDRTPSPPQSQHQQRARKMSSPHQQQLIRQRSDSNNGTPNTSTSTVSGGMSPKSHMMQQQHQQYPSSISPPRYPSGGVPQLQQQQQHHATYHGATMPSGVAAASYPRTHISTGASPVLDSYRSQSADTVSLSARAPRRASGNSSLAGSGMALPPLVRNATTPSNIQLHTSLAQLQIGAGGVMNADAGNGVVSPVSPHPSFHLPTSSQPSSSSSTHASSASTVQQITSIPYSSFHNLRRFHEGHFGVIWRAEISTHLLANQVGLLYSTPTLSSSASSPTPTTTVVVKVPKHRPGPDEIAELFSFLHLPKSEYVLPFLGLCTDWRINADAHHTHPHQTPAAEKIFCFVTEMQKCNLKELALGLPPWRAAAAAATSTNAIASTTNERSRTSSLSSSNDSSGSSSRGSHGSDTASGWPSSDPLLLLQLLHQMALGLSHFHRNHHLHRDISLRNYLLSQQNTVLLCDFGLSRVVGADGKTQAAAAHGVAAAVGPNVVAGASSSSSSSDASSSTTSDTVDRTMLPLRWLAPESLLSHRFNYASDVWSFGVACWELITQSQKPPYSSVVNMREVIALVCTGEIELEFEQKCTKMLEGLLRKCLSVTPSRRPDIASVAKEIEKMIAVQYPQQIVPQAQQQYPQQQYQPNTAFAQTTNMRSMNSVETSISNSTSSASSSSPSIVQPTPLIPPSPHTVTLALSVPPTPVFHDSDEDDSSATERTPRNTAQSKSTAAASTRQLEVVH